MAVPPRSIVALDVGDRRVGVAVASPAAWLPRPLTTLRRDDGFFAALQKILDDQAAGRLVIGLPRDLEGRRTAQTEATEAFAAELKHHYDLPVHLQDEAVTSKQAEAELQARGKTYRREDIDALAATYILEDFLTGNRELID